MQAKKGRGGDENREDPKRSKNWQCEKPKAEEEEQKKVSKKYSAFMNFNRAGLLQNWRNAFTSSHTTVKRMEEIHS